jgi:protocatechuate 3,4-dioxygenase alpha subunit
MAGDEILRATTWQTVGPFFQIGLEHLYVDNLASPRATGQRIEIHGRILDGDGQPVPDAMLELWQADAQGHYAHPAQRDAQETNPAQRTVAHSKEDTPAAKRGGCQTQPPVAAFRGYGRIATATDGSFQFATIKPGRVPAPDSTLQAPHIVVAIFMRGLLRRLVTRIYFPDDEPAHAQDFALKRVDPNRRATLIAQKSAQRPTLLQWNVALQGENETVFFDC